MIMGDVMDDVMDAIIGVRAIDFLRISLSSIGSVWISYNRKGEDLTTMK